MTESRIPRSSVHPLPAAHVRAPWWRRLFARLFARPAPVFCSRCGELKAGSYVPRHLRDDRIECTGAISFDDGTHYMCIRLRVGLG